MYLKQKQLQRRIIDILNTATYNMSEEQKQPQSQQNISSPEKQAQSNQNIEQSQQRNESSPEKNEQSPEKNEERQENVQQGDQLTQQDHETYNNIMSKLTDMNKKIKTAKNKMNKDDMNEKKNVTDEITSKLIESKQTSEIITKENLLTDINQSYEKVVIDVYSENKKLKEKVLQMAEIIKEQNQKLYSHTQRQKDLKSENQKLRDEILKGKDQRMMNTRNVQGNTNIQDSRVQKTKKNATQNSNQEDYDFWSMPQNDQGKKKKDFVGNSNLWVNEKDYQESNVFVTEGTNKRRR